MRTPASTDGARLPRSGLSAPPPWEGRVFGGIVLAAFLLYGIGSAATDRPIGLALVIANSVAVTFAGLIGFRLLRPADRNVGMGYLVARVAEAGLLAGGVLLVEFADVADADTTGYLAAMLALAAGSIPFFRTLRRRGSIPRPLATWGIYGYGILAIGVLLELATGRSLAVLFAVPGGLFEVALGIRLLRSGFRVEARRVDVPLQRN